MSGEKQKGKIDDLSRSWWIMHDGEVIIKKMVGELKDPDKQLPLEVQRQLAKVPKAVPGQCPKCRNLMQNCGCVE